MHHRQHARRGLSQPAMLILATLVQGPKHAVALCEAIWQTEGLYFEPGTLYRLLAHIAAHARCSPGGSSRPRGSCMPVPWWLSVLPSSSGSVWSSWVKTLPELAIRAPALATTTPDA